NGDGRIKLKDQKGSRVYNAFLAIRLLGDPSYKDILEQVEKLLTNKELEEFINLMSAVCKDKPLVEKLLTNNEPEQLINLMSAVYKNKRLVEKLLTNKELEEFINLMTTVCKDKPLVEKLLTNNEPKQLINLMSAVYKNKRLVEKLLTNKELEEFINLMSAVCKDKPLVEKLLTNNEPEQLINLMSAVYKNKRLIEKLLINNEPKQLINLMSAVCKDKRLKEVFYALKLFLSQIWRNDSLKNKKKRRKLLHRIGVKHQKLILQRYGSLSIAIQPLEDMDEIHRGLVTDVFGYDDIEEDETPLEPLFTFFLAEQSDLIRGFYASKSV